MATTTKLNAGIRWTPRWRRRFWSVAAIAALASLTAWFVHAQVQSLQDASWWTGWMLVALIGFLAALGVRRKLVMLPLVPVGTWVQVHIYLGLLTVFIYFLHAPRGIGSGFLEGALSILVWLVTGSGIYGVYLSRTAPRRLAAIGQEVRFDHIPWLRARIAERAASLIANLPSTPDREVLATYYTQHIDRYVRGRPSWWYLCFPSTSRRRRLLTGLTELHRYLSPDQRKVGGELAALLRNRDDLDYHHALQLRLRSWRALHALLTVWLLAFAIAHVLLALRMQGD